MGGGEGVSASVHRIAQQGLRNVLVHVGVLAGREESRASLGKPPARLVSALNREDYILAPESGVFEVEIDLGGVVHAGDRVGQIHFLERLDRAPEPIIAKTDGYLICSRVPCLTTQGDCVAVIAREVTVDEVLHGHP